MGRHQYGKDFQVTANGQGQRKTFYTGHDNREDGAGHAPRGGRGGQAPRGHMVWRRGEGRRVSFNDRRGGAISKRGGRGSNSRPRFDTSRLGALLDHDSDMSGAAGRSGQAGRARPSQLRSLRGKYTIRGGGAQRPPLSLEEKAKVTEVMVKRYFEDRKALDLGKFAHDPGFGVTTTALGRLTDDRVMACVVDIIGENLSGLEEINLADNGLSFLRTFGTITAKAPGIKRVYLERNRIPHHKELENLKPLKLTNLKLDGNPFLSRFKDGSTYSSLIRKTFPTLQLLDDKELPKIITFEGDDEAGPSGSSAGVLKLPPTVATMEVAVDDPAALELITKLKAFIKEYFRVYDEASRDSLQLAYHEEATLSLSTAYPPDKSRDYGQMLDDYRVRSRNLCRVSDPAKRQMLLRQGRLAIVAFLNELPKTEHDLSSFTLDIPFASGNIINCTVSGTFRERTASRSVCHFNRMFVVVRQGEGLCIVNETLFVTIASKRQSEVTDKTLTLSVKTGMNANFAKLCLTNSEWNLDKAIQAFQTAHQEGKIPEEAFIK